MTMNDWNSNPVHFENDAWYFWDETWAYRHGPYESEEEAKDMLNSYCEIELGMSPLDKLSELDQELGLE